MMDNWVKKVRSVSQYQEQHPDHPAYQMGFPVVTVTETADSIHVRQDRFLATGPANPEDNETIWSVPYLTAMHTAAHKMAL